MTKILYFTQFKHQQFTASKTVSFYILHEVFISTTLCPG